MELVAVLGSVPMERVSVLEAVGSGAAVGRLEAAAEVSGTDGVPETSGTPRSGGSPPRSLDMCSMLVTTSGDVGPDQDLWITQASKLLWRERTASLGVLQPVALALERVGRQRRFLPAPAAEDSGPVHRYTPDRGFGERPQETIRAAVFTLE